MATPDPALGFDVDFDDAEFRNAIAFAQQMGMTPDQDKRPKFIRRSDARTYWKNGVEVDTPRLGRDGTPLDADIEIRRQQPEVLTPTCGLEIQEVDPNVLPPVGKFRPTRAVVSLLDTEYAKIQDCREMTYNGDRYVYGYEPAIEGLFEVSTHTIVFWCVDDS